MLKELNEKLVLPQPAHWEDLLHVLRQHHPFVMNSKGQVYKVMTASQGKSSVIGHVEARNQQFAAGNEDCALTPLMTIAVLCGSIRYNNCPQFIPYAQQQTGCDKETAERLYYAAMNEKTTEQDRRELLEACGLA